ncbi:hypothetical protein MAR_007954 [Mya arenaria]|uniref:Uncharacterized protein n=1 Tax=Mya arenaria TaxID=6604 RepID=A0ABY7DYN2_MYAAR|nr:hypothetical protein MAR_007954 [Mya arenaria]
MSSSPDNEHQCLAWHLSIQEELEALKEVLEFLQLFLLLFGQLNPLRIISLKQDSSAVSGTILHKTPRRILQRFG